MVLSKKLKQRIGTMAVVFTAIMGFGSVAYSDNHEAKRSIGAKAGDACVKETAWMRRNHMELLKHDRDRTLRQGIRSVDGSINGCVDCHTNKDESGYYIPVNAEGEFCSGCHNYTSVSIDCFECHATRPDSAVKRAER
ncbi:MAG: sulfur reduction protein DsrJ [Gammaproteobacteria bacterium]|jgi:hypothetical protein|nr:sulfur reduction protein DsrJ [Gammaproteobacteria bacterium]MBT7308730.1 sulfur reduction protein DsrJ [Gammaproteobacteria bacterium]